ncbi:hypothetical protein [Ureibacillus terrenus]|uniref:hypothetical protein n=1 Tax=Ureibacillus terrenus TaxID=118246 RepID=UPI00399D69C0
MSSEHKIPGGFAPLGIPEFSGILYNKIKVFGGHFFRFVLLAFGALEPQGPKKLAVAPRVCEGIETRHSFIPTTSRGVAPRVCEGIETLEELQGAFETARRTPRV